jgi:hypothetical protein
MTRYPTFTISAILFLIGGLLWAAKDAFSQTPPCGPRADIAKKLNDKFGEVPVAMGIVGNNEMKFYLDPKDRSWTMMVIDPRGQACIVATGNEFGPSSETMLGNSS